MTSMTPTEQDKELREAIINIVEAEYKKPNCIPVVERVEQLMQLITADRKRVALEARIDELESLAGSVHENTGARGGASIRGFNTAVRYYGENIQSRIFELEQELEKL